MINNEQFEKGMVGLWDVQLTDMFPEQSTETVCLSYAVYMAMQDIKKYTERLFLSGNIENLPEEILDYLGYGNRYSFVHMVRFFGRGKNTGAV